MVAAVHMVAARLGCKRVTVGTEWTNFHPGCINRQRKCYPHLLGGLFLAGKAAWALSKYLSVRNADYCMFVNEWVWLRSRVCSLRLKVRLNSVLEPGLRQK